MSGKGLRDPRPASNIGYPEPKSSATIPQGLQQQLPAPYSFIAGEGNRQQLRTLLGNLDFDRETNVAHKDTVQQLGLINILSRESQDRAVALMNSEQIHTWLTSITSSVLHINGQMFLSEYEARQSPLSYTCAKFVDSILAQTRQSQASTSSPTVVLRWFCGQHTNFRTDFDAHPPGMLNNLLAQLINQLLKLGLESTLGNLPSLGHDPTLSDLCELFVKLTRSLPVGTRLFCILDGVSYYEDAQRGKELKEVLLMLKTLTRQTYEAWRGPPLIKILTTTPLRLFLASRVFEKDEVFDMKERYPPNGGFTPMQWDTGIGRVLTNSFQDMERWTETDIRSSTNYSGAESAHHVHRGTGRRVIQ